MNLIKNIPDKATTRLSSFVTKNKKYIPNLGFFFLFGVIVFLAAIASTDFSQKPHVLIAGEIAPNDITADRFFLFEDTLASKEKRAQVKQMQPLVCDLVLVPIDELRTLFQNLFTDLNQATTLKEKEQIKESLSRETHIELTQESLDLLSDVAMQKQITESILPFIQQQMSVGVLLEMRPALHYKGGIIVRNIETKEETYFPEVESIADIKSLETIVSQRFKEVSGSSRNKRILTNTLMAIIQPTLVPNYEATLERASLAEKQVTPVMQRIDKGEVIVRQGEKVSRDQQLKLQYIMDTKSKWFDPQFFLGIVLCGFLLSTGVLFSPSGRPTSEMKGRDFIFIGLLILLFSLMAKGLFFLGEQLSATSLYFSPETVVYAVPVAGAASLASLIFSTRRYLVTGLLLAFFSTLMVKGGVGFFIFYFLSAMLGTWLISRTQSRQDIIWSALPMAGGLIAMWLGATLLHGGSADRFLPEAIAVLSGVFISLTLTFALAPLIEMIFGYTTRFRLMELLNLEQPLLRDLMINAPGTYHHSLIVSNMVEAGAESIGAHSLLCKVAALYHDIGKVSKAVYFIENQFSSENPHDKLTPSMSALILTSHIKIGVELAKEHHLGQEIIDILRQHHGTSVIRYFYQKALRLDDGHTPKEEDYSYPEQKPQTKEAALVLLADAVEASSRTLQDPGVTKLQQHIETIIKGIYSSGQLDECELTFRDLDTIAVSFHRVLRGIFHHRIAYPDKLSQCSPQSFLTSCGVSSESSASNQNSLNATPATTTRQ